MMNMELIDLTPVQEAQIALLATIITVKVIPWIKSRTTVQQQEYLLATTRVLVYAAEQLFGAGKGADKFAYVTAELEKRGLKVDAAAIEASVREMDLMEQWETMNEVEDEANDGKE